MFEDVRTLGCFKLIEFRLSDVGHGIKQNKGNLTLPFCGISPNHQSNFRHCGESSPQQNEHTFPVKRDI